MRRSAVLGIAIIVLLIGTLAARARIPTLSAQIDPAVATAVQQRLDATATAAAQFGPMQTIEAAFNQALTATAAFNLTVEAALNQAVQSTYAAMYGTPVVQEFDGVPMVQVPAGCFLMGSADGDDDEQPIHEQCFDEPFWIDQTEVTQADFERLGGVKAIANGFDGDQRPVERITWFEARNFCALRGARLPTEAEWEYAARGPDALVYPWGNAWNENNAVWNRSSSQGTANVGSIPAERSWVGAFDLSGNVWEWTSSLYENYPYDQADGRERDTGNETDVPRVLRGGSWDSNYIVNLRSAIRNRGYPDGGVSYVGFRCARSNDITAAQAESTLTLSSERNTDPGSVVGAVTRNADWTPVVQEFDGVPMVQVPVGCFMMGMTQAEIDELILQYPDGAEFITAFGPQHQQCFDTPFWIDQTEVTQADFERLGGVAANPSQFSGDQRPVESITWFEARDFCALRGARLPTEAEWEYAARGPDGLVYPWGNDWDENNAVWAGNSNGQTATVGSIPAGRAWVGAFDLSGNVWEWTSSLYENYPYDQADGRERDTGNSTNVLRVLRGGSWINDYTDVLRSAGRYWNYPDYWSVNYGFRCARSR